MDWSIKLGKENCQYIGLGGCTYNLSGTHWISGPCRPECCERYVAKTSDAPHFGYAPVLPINLWDVKLNDSFLNNFYR